MVNPHGFLKKNQTRKLIRIQISLEQIVNMLRIPEDGVVVDGELITATDNPIQEDSKVVGYEINNQKQCLELVLESKAYPDVYVSQGDPISVMNPWYKSQRLSEEEVIEHFRRKRHSY